MRRRGTDAVCLHEQRQTEIVVVASHPGDDIADAAPAVEPVVKQPQLRLVHRHKAEPDSGAQEAGARVAEAVGPVNGETYGAGPFGGITSSASAPTVPPRDESRAALCTAP